MPLVKFSTFGWVCQKIGFLVVLGILFFLITLFSRISPRRAEFDVEYTLHSSPSPEEEELASYVDKYVPPRCPSELALLTRDELARKNFYFDCEVLTRPGLTHWRVLNCKSTERCGLGHLLVQPYDYTKCQQLKGEVLSMNQTFDSFLKVEFGPDAFLARIHGSQLYAMDQWIFTDDCTYKFPYHLPFKSGLFLDLIHLGSGYNAISEMRNSKGATSQTILKNHALHLCDECVPTSLSHDMPACQPNQELNGILETTADGRTTWRPAGCIPPTVDGGCLVSKRRIIFLGDPFLHGVMNELFGRFPSDTNQLVDPTSTIRQAGNVKGIFLKHSGFLTTELLTEIKQADTVVLSLPRNQDKAMSDYVEQGAHLIEQILSISETPLTIYKVDNGVPYQAGDPWPQIYREQLGNRLISARFHPSPNFHSIHAFQESLSLFDMDLIHPNREALWASILVNRLLVKLKFCE
ncbi:hypothetical protein K493DRAFT_344981 [Basidiobolus meristosporus CBS 931.73]|uniref:Uncharacterized protein n=1 Tax=Basidiobolus meristosporus CBS 931.73 TaxID=1314790 RepID=A0A1Y1Z5P3_9FUNG|nr:hypothetical protein K493DRAFT_344981 [Basidiobolus meristosporus CBS 931.73]|eukprot:ORY05536.1 hypothetical protein K493DRAFT_344981 [Basidiobolus meristosporus CBS 931.73]